MDKIYLGNRWRNCRCSGHLFRILIQKGKKMAHRVRTNTKRDSRIFARTAMKVKSINITNGLPRGGRNLNQN